MNPIEVVIKSSGKCVGYACEKCQSFYAAPTYVPEDIAADESRKRAEACCSPKVCGTCQGPNARQYMRRDEAAYVPEFLCDTCRDKAWAKDREERQAKAFERATKVAASDYSDPVFWPGRDADNGFFMSTGDLLGYCEDEGCDPPAFVWGSERAYFLLDADSIVDAALEEHHENARVEPSEIERLQEMLDAWCADQKVKSYEEDQTVAVVLDYFS